ncbi:hypothetical protein GCM10022384_63950 [Streptomyces marokkonensis]|uniref:Hydrolase of the HAD superfamily n=1 Tax=Streptomyces marokkonensis TaxID=324855 RepID=A0ABP7SC05_9ACTN
MNGTEQDLARTGGRGADVAPTRKLFLFDCYDTLVLERTPGSAPAPAALFAHHLGVTETTAKRILYPILSAAFRPSSVQEATTDLLGRGLRRQGLEQHLDRARDALWWAMGNGDGRHIAAPDCAEVLRHIKKAGHEVRLISNCVLEPEGMHRLLTGLGLSEFIDRAYYSSEGLGRKPDLAFFSRAAAGQWDTVVMVGDSEPLDMAPARTLGMRTVQVDPGRPGWDEVLRLA